MRGCSALLGVFESVCKRTGADRNEFVASAEIRLRLKLLNLTLKLCNAVVRRARILRELESLLRRLKCCELCFPELFNDSRYGRFYFVLIAGSNSSLNEVKARICAGQGANQCVDHECPLRGENSDPATANSTVKSFGARGSGLASKSEARRKK